MANVAQMWGNVYSLFTNFAVIGMSSFFRKQIPDCKVLIHQSGGEQGLKSLLLKYSCGGSLTYSTGLIFSVISPLMLIFVSITFCLFWVAYRHNYYFVQRNKVDTHGLLFNNAISQLFAGIYVMEIALIGLFLLVRDSQNNVACKSQAIIMIVALILTAVFHFTMEQHLMPLYEFLPVTLEDSAVAAERRLLLRHHDSRPSQDEGSGESKDITTSKMSPTETLDDQTLNHKLPRSMTANADLARKAMSKLRKETAARVADIQAHLPEPIDVSRRREVADQLAAAIAGYPDELTDLTPEERQAQLKAAFQDPVTREPAPIIWVRVFSILSAISVLFVVLLSQRNLQLSVYARAAMLTPGSSTDPSRPSRHLRGQH